MDYKTQSELAHKANKLIKAARAGEANSLKMSRFSEYALRQIAKEIVRDTNDSVSVPQLVRNFMENLQDQLEDNLQNCKLDLESALEEDAEIPEKNQGTLTPSEKLKEYLESTCGVIGYTDDILKAVSAAYGIVLEPNLY